MTTKSKQTPKRGSLHAVVIPVCYLLEGSDKVEWGNMVKVEAGRVRFDDGGWNPAESCFLSEAQCMRYHSRPPKNWNSRNEKQASKLEAIAEQLRRREQGGKDEDASKS